MRILLIHNKYLHYGGEDSTFQNELNLLRKNHNVKSLVFDNQDIGKDRTKFQVFGDAIYNKFSYKEIENVIIDFRPTVVHVHNFYYVVSPSVFFLAKKYNIPIVATVQNYRLICSGAYLLRNNSSCELCVNKTFPIHGIIHKCNRGSYRQSIALVALTGYHKVVGTWKNKVDKFIVVTDFSKRKLMNSSLNLSSDKIVVKPNSVEDLGFVNQYDREDFFLFVGRLSSEKGIHVLVNAAKLANVKIKILGDGPLKSLVVKTCAENDNLEYLGFKDRLFIIDMMKKCKALVFPSIWYEGLPLTILESFSTGTPVICSDIDNLNEIVRHLYTGMSFKTGNPLSLKESLEYFNSNEELVSRLYSNCRREFVNRYSQEVNYSNLISIYESLTRKPSD